MNDLFAPDRAVETPRNGMTTLMTGGTGDATFLGSAGTTTASGGSGNDTYWTGTGAMTIGLTFPIRRLCFLPGAASGGLQLSQNLSMLLTDWSEGAEVDGVSKFKSTRHAGCSSSSMTTYAAVRAKASIIDRVRMRAPTYWQYLRERPSWILMFLFARTLVGRRVERWLNRAGYRQPAPVAGSMLNSIDTGAAVRGLIDHGVHLGFKLPPDMVRQIRGFAETTPCFARDRQGFGFLPKDVDEANRTRERDIIAGYYFEAVDKSPAITKLCEDPLLLTIAEAYIGHPPILIRKRLWWSFPATRVTDADLHAVAQEKFHFDMNGWRTLKFFFYLTSTDERAGAHRCILGSHKSRPIRQQLTLTVGRATEELEEVYGKQRFLTIVGEAGTGFAEDPFVFHTGSLCQDQPRLILELEYGPTTVSPSYRYGRLG